MTTYAKILPDTFIKSDRSRIYAVGEDIEIDGVPTGTATGTDTYAVTITGIEAYATLQGFWVLFTNANTGSSTINVNSLGAKSLKKSVTTNLAGGDILAGEILLIIYDGTNFQCIGK